MLGEDDATLDDDDLTYLYWLSSKHPFAADKRRSDFDARVDPRMKTVFAIGHYADSSSHHRSEHPTMYIWFPDKIPWPSPVGIKRQPEVPVTRALSAASRQD